MAAPQSIETKSNCRIAALALSVFALDQLSKWLVQHTIYEGEEKNVIPGFFNLAHRANTGAAWSLFTGNNTWLAVIAVVALVALFLARRHFHSHTLTGQLALGLIFGGIIGNLTDRLLPGRQAVVDFLHFYLLRRGGEPLDFPAFNVADSAICTGVALIFIINLRNESAPKPVSN
ncbi:MAG: signal peptidase II [Limisphaerales bacterium]